MNIEGWILAIIGQLFVAAAIWGGIRAEIKNIHENHRALHKRVERVEDRMDSVMDMRRGEK